MVNQHSFFLLGYHKAMSSSTTNNNNHTNDTPNNMNCETLRQRLLNHGYDIDHVYSQGIRGCTFRIRDENNRFYVKKILNQEDWVKFNDVRRDFDEKEVDFYDFHPRIILDGNFLDGWYFIDMEMGQAVPDHSSNYQEVLGRLRQLHQHGLYHGDLLRSGGDGHGAPVLNMHNVVRMPDGFLRFIDFGNQYGHDDPFAYEVEQQTISKTDVREEHRRKVRERSRENAAKRRRDLGANRLDFGESPKKRKPPQPPPSFQGGSCNRKVDSEECIHACSLDDDGITRWLQESARDMRQEEDANALNDGDKKETYMMIRRVAERANQVARKLNPAIDDLSLPPGWDPSNYTTDWNQIFRVLQRDAMEGHIGYYENDGYENLDARYPTALAPGVQLRRRQGTVGKFCIVYFRQHLVLAEKKGEGIVLLNPGEDMGNFYSATWCGLAKIFFDQPDATCRVEHLDVQGYNDCSVWVQLLMAGRGNNPNNDPDDMFEKFVKKF
jgi:hypothetical protein